MKEFDLGLFAQLQKKVYFFCV